MSKLKIQKNLFANQYDKAAILAKLLKFWIPSDMPEKHLDSFLAATRGQLESLMKQVVVGGQKVVYKCADGRPGTISDFESNMIPESGSIIAKSPCEGRKS